MASNEENPMPKTIDIDPDRYNLNAQKAFQEKVQKILPLFENDPYNLDEEFINERVKDLRVLSSQIVEEMVSKWPSFLKDLSVGGSEATIEQPELSEPMRKLQRYLLKPKSLGSLGLLNQYASSSDEDEVSSSKSNASASDQVDDRASPVPEPDNEALKELLPEWATTSFKKARAAPNYDESSSDS